MKKCLLFIALPVLLLSSCRNKKPSLTDDTSVDIHDFIDFFQPLKLPCQFTDTALSHREQETMRIGNKSFSQFVPDTVLSRYFGKLQPRLYAFGRAGEKKMETYLFVKAVTSVKKAVYLLCFDKDHHFATGMPLMFSDDNNRYGWLVSMDPKYTISVTRRRKSADGQPLYKRDAYVYSDGNLILILTESNESSAKSLPIINPIDTLSHKHKFTGDYRQDSRNLISVRDGKDPSHVLIFVHFEKDNGNCKGELKGRARFINATTAQYHSASDPCVVEFSFGTNTVRMKELEACGSHRDIKCFFEGVYRKREKAKGKGRKT